MEALKDTSILSWNVRGASNSVAKRHLKEVTRKFSPTFLVIMETHISFSRLNTFWSNLGYVPVHIIEAQGHSGGLWLMKNSSSQVNTSIIDYNAHSITFSLSRGHSQSTCTCLYASPNPTIRTSLWSYLTTLSHGINGPWMLIGDFNETLLPSDQRGGTFSPSRAAIFSKFLENCNLLDLTTTGGRFTWHRNTQGTRSLSKKLDRGISNVEWRLAFPEAFVDILCRFHSDHNPIFLRFGGLPLARGPRPFRFEAAWIDHDDYSSVVERAWCYSNHNPVTALQLVRDNSIKFNHEVFGNIFQKKKHIEARLKGIQKYLERVDSAHHVHLEYQLQQEYNHILFQEEIHWYQKSREQWVKFGDKNSSFFHAQTIIRRKRNKIHNIQLPTGIWSSDSSIIQHETQKFFKDLFCSPQSPHNHSFVINTHPIIDADGCGNLTKDVTKEEVTLALNSMKPFKAPGPDGFQCIFFKQYWHIVGDDIYNLVKNAFATGHFDSKISETLIAVIPKEVVHYMRKSKKKKGDVAFKLDLEKAFDNAKKSQLRFITNLFDVFSRASGLKINISKSRALFSSGIPRAKIQQLTSITGIRSTPSLGKYLGFSILNGRAKKSDFDFIIEKMQTRLASWKSKLLNKPGRLALASSVLTSIPSYYMQIAWLPQSICNIIDHTTRHFIWKGSTNTGINLVGWQKISCPKRCGGLGIRAARDMNTSLLGKLVWDLLQDSDKLWVRVLSDKYISGTRILSSDTLSGSSTWNSIMKAKNVLRTGFVWRPGSGNSSFWYSHWSHFGPLGAIVPYVHYHDTALMVKDVFVSSTANLHLLYTQLPQEVVISLNSMKFSFNSTIEDTMIWSANKHGTYTTSSGYLWILSLRSQLQSNQSWNLPTLWLFRGKFLALCS
ncbi:unnamed protein product [Trifolium pratense]|uniref:Uncharacterized protein n=1 Tax=Trifolium pratense TaxID=57577 RepID=A0ACB0LPX5_TRIPR|nr:unnamed protein product [Trifolium pratense]